MRKSKLRDGRPFLGIKIEMFVTMSVFATALGEHYYEQSELFPEKLRKTDAMNILNKRLFNHGIQGEYAEGFFEAADESVVEPYNDAYRKAMIWVAKNYPYLNYQF